VRLHDEKPAVAPHTASLSVDLVIWHPSQQDAIPLTTALTKYGFGERSQTVVWLDKFTVRLTMWRHRYFTELSDADWAEAGAELVALLRDIHATYHPKSIIYDTRAFSVGIRLAAKRRRMPVERVATAPPVDHPPVQWELKF
jgi:hypothetical protein